MRVVSAVDDFNPAFRREIHITFCTAFLIEDAVFASVDFQNRFADRTCRISSQQNQTVQIIFSGIHGSGGAAQRMSPQIPVRIIMQPHNPGSVVFSEEREI